jgi:hypothetical protein
MDKIFAIIFFAAFLFFTGLEIYCWITYGNSTFEETPNWVNWIMFRWS